ncbi:acyl-CoA dehydrogenase family protein [Massilia niabensis]|uniref:Acyl-CoA dehydrogenase family protein n=1 Tax=Massilia niabensis TaxID=544910 RepID=A0ABW0LC79_9BURK
MTHRPHPMEPSLSPSLPALKAQFAQIVDEVVAPRAAAVDAGCHWPRESLEAFAAAGLAGLQVPTHLGGHGGGLGELLMATELIGAACPSSALCFGMHCVGTAVIAAKATPWQEEHYLRPIAAGRHLTTLALSESGSGAHFYLPGTTLTPAGPDFLVDGVKQFVTNGGHADSYVISTLSAGADAGDFSCLVVDAGTPGIEWLAPWEGFGMRGNSSRGMRLSGAPVPSDRLLGEHGDQVWYVFEVVAPYFLMAMAGTYLGVAQSALDAAGEHLRNRSYAHSGESLRDVETLQTRYAEMWMAVEKTRALVYEAARRGDAGDPDALPYILACKADAGDTAVHLANEAMTICGGAAYRDNSRVAQMLRDARASHVMSPTTDLLRLWTGRSLLGLPLL